MSYLATCTFDLKDASRQDYVDAYAVLADIGLSTSIASDVGREFDLPTTMTAGVFRAESAASLRDALCKKIAQAFKAGGFSSEIFVTVGGDWG